MNAAVADSASQSPAAALCPARFLRLLWTCAWIVTALKLACAALTLGTVDVGSFFGFGEEILREGIEHLYQTEPLFNHMPLAGMGSALIYKMTGGSPRLFAFFWRLPAIAADLVTLAALLRVAPLACRIMRRGLLLFALSPVSFMVSGFHGNVDPVMVAFLVLAAVACVEGRLTGSAMFFALACNVKTPALLLAPVFFFFWTARKKGVPFFGLTAALTLLGWSYPLLVCPRDFIAHVLGYGSYWGTWGLTYWLWLSGWEPFASMRFGDFTPAQSAVLWPLKLLVIGATFTLAWKRRRLPGTALFDTIAAVWIFFLVWSPGVAAQYLVWPAPFLLLFSVRDYRWATLACTVHLAIMYTVLCRGFPWYFAIAGHGLNPNAWLASANVAWAAFVWIGWRNARTFFFPANSEG